MKEIVIESGRAERHYWRDLWRSRELLVILALRDLSVRYKQTILGASWSLIRPLITMLIMVVVFSLIAKLPPDPGIPYPLMVLSGLTVWNFFSTAFMQISFSITTNSNLVTKVYFPRLLLPLSSILVSFVDFLITLVLFVGIALWYRFVPNYQIIFLPIFVLLALVAAFAFGLFFAVVNVRFRDIGQLIPFIVQIGFYICPIAYSSRLVAGEWFYPIYCLNPMVGIIDGFRWSLLGEKAYFNPVTMLPSLGITLTVLLLSLWYFRKQESTFVDTI